MSSPMDITMTSVEDDGEMRNLVFDVSVVVRREGDGQINPIDGLDVELANLDANDRRGDVRGVMYVRDAVQVELVSCSVGNVEILRSDIQLQVDVRENGFPLSPRSPQSIPATKNMKSPSDQEFVLQAPPKRKIKTEGNVSPKLENIEDSIMMTESMSKNSKILSFM